MGDQYSRFTGYITGMVLILVFIMWLASSPVQAQGFPEVEARDENEQSKMEESEDRKIREIICASRENLKHKNFDYEISLEPRALPKRALIGPTCPNSSLLFRLLCSDSPLELRCSVPEGTAKVPVYCSLELKLSPKDGGETLRKKTFIVAPCNISASKQQGTASFAYFPTDASDKYFFEWIVMKDKFVGAASKKSVLLEPACER